MCEGLLSKSVFILGHFVFLFFFRLFFLSKFCSVKTIKEGRRQGVREGLWLHVYLFGSGCEARNGVIRDASAVMLFGEGLYRVTE